MRNEIKFAGFGGQGVVKSAIILSLASGLYEGKEVAQTQSYGPEARGGACRSEVVISDEQIDYIKPLQVDSFVVMSQPAMDQYVKEIDQQEPVVIADTTLVRAIPKKLKKVYHLEATRIAEQEFGNAIYANIIMLGALSSITGLVALEAAYKFGDPWLKECLTYIQENLDFLTGFIQEKISAINMIPPEGTYLAWLDFRNLGLDDMALRDLIRKQARLGLEDGYTFGPGGEGFQRMNIACPRSILQEALERLEKAVNSI